MSIFTVLHKQQSTSTNSPSKVNEILISRGTQVHDCKNSDPGFYFCLQQSHLLIKPVSLTEVQLKFNSMFLRETQVEHSDHLSSTNLFADHAKLVKFPCTQYSYLNNDWIKIMLAIIIKLMQRLASNNLNFFC